MILNFDAVMDEKSYIVFLQSIQKKFQKKTENQPSNNPHKGVDPKPPPGERLLAR